MNPLWVVLHERFAFRLTMPYSSLAPIERITTMTGPSLKVLLGFSLLLVSLDTEAARRAIRVEFNEWDEAQNIGSVDCPGSDAHSTEVLWNGIRFSGAGDPVYLIESYCQHSFNYEGDDFGAWVNEDYFNQEFVNEPGLADLFGPNKTEPLITAIRYTYLDGDRDELDTNGFQWAFYFFPGGITIVALYGTRRGYAGQHHLYKEGRYHPLAGRRGWFQR